MTDFKASDQDVNRAIRSWLHEHRHEDVSRVARAVLDQVETTPQRRVTWWPARRTPTVNKLFGFGLAAAAVVVVLIVGTQFVGSPGTGGVGAGPTTTPEPTATPEPTPTPAASAPPLTETFTSTVHGISMSYPEGWIARTATGPWTESANTPIFTDDHADILYDPILRDHLFFTIASQPIGDSTAEEWVAAKITGGGCSATEPIEVDGATGLTGAGADDCDMAAVTADGRGYWIHLRTSNDDPDAVAPYDREWFEEVLATVQLHPEDAVD